MKDVLEKEFVPYSQSSKMKAIGFQEPCIRGWDKDSEIWYHPDSEIVLDNPTFSQAFRWFRDNNYCKLAYVPLRIAKLVSIDGLSYEAAERKCLDDLIEIAEFVQLKTKVKKTKIKS